MGTSGSSSIKSPAKKRQQPNAADSSDDSDLDDDQGAEATTLDATRAAMRQVTQENPPSPMAAEPFEQFDQWEREVEEANRVIDLEQEEAMRDILARRAETAARAQQVRQARAEAEEKDRAARASVRRSNAEVQTVSIATSSAAVQVSPPVAEQQMAHVPIDLGTLQAAAGDDSDADPATLLAPDPARTPAIFAPFRDGYAPPQYSLHVTQFPRVLRDLHTIGSYVPVPLWTGWEYVRDTAQRTREQLRDFCNDAGDYQHNRRTPPRTIPLADVYEIFLHAENILYEHYLTQRAARVDGAPNSFSAVTAMFMMRFRQSCEEDIGRNNPRDYIRFPVEVMTTLNYYNIFGIQRPVATGIRTPSHLTSLDAGLNELRYRNMGTVAYVQANFSMYMHLANPNRVAPHHRATVALTQQGRIADMSAYHQGTMTTLCRELQEAIDKYTSDADQPPPVSMTKHRPDWMPKPGHARAPAPDYGSDAAELRIAGFRRQRDISLADADRAVKALNESNANCVEFDMRAKRAEYDLKQMSSTCKSLRSDNDRYHKDNQRLRAELEAAQRAASATSRTSDPARPSTRTVSSTVLRITSDPASSQPPRSHDAPSSSGSGSRHHSRSNNASTSSGHGRSNHSASSSTVRAIPSLMLMAPLPHPGNAQPNPASAHQPRHQDRPGTSGSGHSASSSNSRRDAPHGKGRGRGGPADRRPK